MLPSLLRWSVVVALAACAAPDVGEVPAGTRDPQGGSAQLPPTSSSPAPGASDPVGESPAPCVGGRGPGDYAHKVKVGELEREFLVHVPPGPKRTMPLVLVWHALTLTGTKPAILPTIRELTGFDAHADKRGFVTVYPEGIGKSWNGGECCVEAKAKNIDDVGFAKVILAEVAKDACVDEARVYSTGFSNGGFFSHRLACELGDRFAAIASVSGTLGVPEDTCVPKAPISVLQIHGTEDPLVPFLGGSPKIPLGGIFGTFSSVAATVAHWEAHDACTGSATQTLRQGMVTCTHKECAAGSEVGLCTVEGGGHQWPGSKPLPAMGPQTQDADATALIVDFLLSHTRPTVH
ncbi:MAG: hydrolase [Myxococcales bacterium]|nr:hydrolase [Myxococcales bacterium]